MSLFELTFLFSCYVSRLLQNFCVRAGGDVFIKAQSQSQAIGWRDQTLCFLIRESLSTLTFAHKLTTSHFYQVR